MAYLDDEQNKQNQQGQSAQDANNASSTGASLGGAFAGGISGVNPTGTSLGPNNWTNVQAYLGANKGDTGTQNALNKQVGGTLDSEKTNFGQANQSAYDPANQYLQNHSISQDQVWGALGNLANEDTAGGTNYTASYRPTNTGAETSDSNGMYAWKGTGYDGKESDAYKNTLADTTGKLYGDYTGPGNFNYANSADYQNYNNLLGQGEQGKNDLLNSVYKNAAGGQWTNGMNALQSQIDQNNQSTLGATQNLRNAYGAFNNQQASDTANTNQEIQNAMGQNATNKSTLDALQNRSKSLDNTMQSYTDRLNQARNHTSLAGNPAAVAGYTSAWVPTMEDMSGGQANVQAHTLGIGDLRQADPSRQQYNAIQDLLNNSKGKIGKNNFTVNGDIGGGYAATANGMAPFTPQTVDYGQLYGAAADQQKLGGTTTLGDPTIPLIAGLTDKQKVFGGIY
jgi:hypothetical protein